MILLLCILLIGAAAWCFYEAFEWDRRIWGDPEWRLDEREAYDLTPAIRGRKRS